VLFFLVNEARFQRMKNEAGLCPMKHLRA